MEKKERLKEMINNLNRTINKMTDKKRYQSQSSAFETPSANKSRLVRTRDKIIKTLKAL